MAVGRRQEGALPKVSLRVSNRCRAPPAGVQGTHVKFIASQEPTMEAIMQANQENGGGAGGEEQRQAAREPAAVGPRSKL